MFSLVFVETEQAEIISYAAIIAELFANKMHF